VSRFDSLGKVYFLTGCLSLKEPTMKPITRDGQTFWPTDRSGNYRIPRKIFDVLEHRLRAYKNREAAHILAAFLARMNAVPERHGPNGNPFPIDRRALSGHPELGLAEYVIRGAIKTLEAVGFIDRIPEKGTGYQRVAKSIATKAGIKRTPILFVFGSDFASFFAWIVRKCLSRPIDRLVKSSTFKDNINLDGNQGIGVCVSMGQKRTPRHAFDFNVAALARKIAGRR
jgi:hypothetical protein